MLLTSMETLGNFDIVSRDGASQIERAYTVGSVQFQTRDVSWRQDETGWEEVPYRVRMLRFTTLWISAVSVAGAKRPPGPTT
jgi:hypothetical protein